MLAVFVLCLAAWRFAPTPLLAAWLAAWWFLAGLVMGGLANVWVHNLTGGAWGEAIRSPLLDLARGMPLLALLFLPLLAGLHGLYPWMQHADTGPARWAGELAAKDAGFKSAWLTPWFFALRSLVVLVLWIWLAYLSRQPRHVRSAPFACVALIAYAFSVSVAAVDWLGSLTPLWYSSIFGLLAGTGQMLSGLALAVVLAARRAPVPPPLVFRDLGNLLMMYVLVWAYLAFSQFLIIWAEDLPHEIVWYVPRMSGGWLAVAWLLVLFHFFAPLLILLVRDFKEARMRLAGLAAALLGVHQLDVWWSVLPSLSVAWPQWLWAIPFASAALVLLLWWSPAKDALRAAPGG